MGHNRQPELYAAALITYTAAAVALVFRLVARRQTSHPLVWEDVLAAVAFVCILNFLSTQGLQLCSLPEVLSLSSVYTVCSILQV